eukprot:Clim_evm6s108 gene=Clim_evmTU6s108
MVNQDGLVPNLDDGKKPSLLGPGQRSTSAAAAQKSLTRSSTESPAVSPRGLSRASGGGSLRGAGQQLSSASTGANEDETRQSRATTASAHSDIDPFSELQEPVLRQSIESTGSAPVRSIKAASGFNGGGVRKISLGDTAPRRPESVQVKKSLRAKLDAKDRPTHSLGPLSVFRKPLTRNAHGDTFDDSELDRSSGNDFDDLENATRSASAAPPTDRVAFQGQENELSTPATLMSASTENRNQLRSVSRMRAKTMGQDSRLGGLDLTVAELRGSMDSNATGVTTDSMATATAPYSVRGGLVKTQMSSQAQKEKEIKDAAETTGKEMKQAEALRREEREVQRIAELQRKIESLSHKIEREQQQLQAMEAMSAAYRAVPGQTASNKMEAEINLSRKNLDKMRSKLDEYTVRIENCLHGRTTMKEELKEYTGDKLAQFKGAVFQPFKSALNRGDRKDMDNSDTQDYTHTDTKASEFSGRSKLGSLATQASDTTYSGKHPIPSHTSAGDLLVQMDKDGNVVYIPSGLRHGSGGQIPPEKNDASDRNGGNVDDQVNRIGDQGTVRFRDGGDEEGTEDGSAGSISKVPRNMRNSMGSMYSEDDQAVPNPTLAFNLLLDRLEEEAEARRKLEERVRWLSKELVEQSVMLKQTAKDAKRHAAVVKELRDRNDDMRRSMRQNNEAIERESRKREEAIKEVREQLLSQMRERYHESQEDKRKIMHSLETRISDIRHFVETGKGSQNYLLWSIISYIISAPLQLILLLTRVYEGSRNALRGPTVQVVDEQEQAQPNYRRMANANSRSASPASSRPASRAGSRERGLDRPSGAARSHLASNHLAAPGIKVQETGSAMSSPYKVGIPEADDDEFAEAHETPSQFSNGDGQSETPPRWDIDQMNNSGSSHNDGSTRTSEKELSVPSLSNGTTTANDSLSQHQTRYSIHSPRRHLQTYSAGRWNFDDPFENHNEMGDDDSVDMLKKISKSSSPKSQRQNGGRSRSSPSASPVSQFITAMAKE